MLRDLEDFERAYSACISAQGKPEYAALRLRAMGLVVLADRALRGAGVTPYASPPPAVGGPVRHGLSNVAFLYEEPLSSFFEDEFQNATLGYIASGHAVLERALGDARRRRWNPLFWLDGAVSVLLGVPAYLLSKLFGVPRSKIDESRFGTTLRLAAVVVEAGLVFVTGKAARLW
jgi:hypothetical protein